MARNVERYRAAERRLWDSVRVSPTERRVQLPSRGTVRVLEIGEGPPVVFVHGGSSSGANWAPLIAGLTGFRCLALDRPGCGLSDPRPEGEGLRDISGVESYADRLIADVLDGLELPSAHVVATSYGGYFAFRGAAAHPDRIDSIVEMSCPIGAPMESIPMSMRFAAVPGLGVMMTKIPPTRAAVRMILRQIGLRRALESGRVSDELMEWFLSLLRDTDTMRNEMRSSPKVISPIRGQNPRMILADELLGRVTMPVQFLWGGEDPTGGADVARRFSAAFPHASLEILPEAGHAPWIDDPELTARLTREFLETAPYDRDRSRSD